MSRTPGSVRTPPARLWAVPTLLILLAATPLVGQDTVTVRPVPLRSQLLLQPARIATPVVATGPDGGWVVAQGAEFRSSGIPEEMYEKLREYTDGGQSIIDVAFTATGGWTIVASEDDWTRNVGGDYFDALQRLRRSGRTIQAVAFNPDGWRQRRGFIIAHDQGAEGSGVPTELRNRLAGFIRDGRAVHDIAFTPGGGWTIVTDRGNWTRNVGGPSPSYFETLNQYVERDATAWAAAFYPPDYDRDHGWLLVTDQGYFGIAVPRDLARALEGVSSLDGRVLDRPAGPVADAEDEPSEGRESGGEAESDLRVVGWTLDAGEPSYSAISGVRGDRIRRIELNEPMTGLRIGENNNRPCSVAVWSMDGSTNGVRCDRGNEHGRQQRQVDIGDHAVQRLRTCHRYIHSLWDRNSAEIKGAAIVGSLVRDDASFDPNVGRDEFDLPNCRSWSSWVACPVDHIASGVVAHFKVRGRRQQLEGLQLICRQVVPRLETP